MLKKLQKSKGFTLIEVVIVIAIGALIILVVLQAVSNAQQSQRDSTRRQEAAQISSALESYAANNQGDYPSDASSVKNEVVDTSYVSQAIQDRNWEVRGTQNCGSVGSTEYKLEYTAIGSPPRDYELFVCLEQGDDKVEIRDN